MKKTTLLLFFAGLFLFETAHAQIRMRPRYRRPAPQASQQSGYKPALSLSFGYGYPNLDKDHLLDFYQYTRSPAIQKGPLFGSLDYRFNRNTSIGAMVSYGKAEAPYYAYNSSPSATPAFTGYLTNWSAMLNLVRYMPGSKTASPYLRTAFGVNVWNQNYLNAAGAKVVTALPDAPAFAYQASLGVKFHFSQHAGVFAEAGYGKYIVSGGLTFKLN